MKKIVYGIIILATMSYSIQASHGLNLRKINPNDHKIPQTCTSSLRSVSKYTPCLPGRTAKDESGNTYVSMIWPNGTQTKTKNPLWENNQPMEYIPFHQSLQQNIQTSRYKTCNDNNHAQTGIIILGAVVCCICCCQKNKI